MFKKMSILILIATMVFIIQNYVFAQWWGDNNSDGGEYLGEYSSNPYDSDSVSNPYGQYGSEYSPNSVNNPYGQYGSPYSPQSVNNPYATDTPKIYSQDGEYLGKASSNPYDPDSVSNPYGRYGSQYSPDSVNNPYGKYGSPYSPESANNPYTTSAPVIIYGRDNE